MRDICLVYAIPVGYSAPYNGLYGDSPPKRDNFFRLEVYKTGTAEQFPSAELTSDLPLKWERRETEY